MYIHICVYTYIYIYICIHIHIYKGAEYLKGYNSSTPPTMPQGSKSDINLEDGTGDSKVPSGRSVYFTYNIQRLVFVIHCHVVILFK
jgi:hypothetical protein